jgi:starch synthase (maltosyl-transferring)
MTVALKRSMTLAPIPPLLSSREALGLSGATGIPMDGDMTSRTDRDGLVLWWDPTDFPLDADPVREHPRSFSVRLADHGQAVIDPRTLPHRVGRARLRTDAANSWDLVAASIEQTLTHLSAQAIAGIVVKAAATLDATFLAAMSGAVRAAGLPLLVEAAGLDEDQIQAVRGKADAFVLKADALSSIDLLDAVARLGKVAPLYLCLADGRIAFEQVALADGVIGEGLSAQDSASLRGLLVQLSGADGDRRMVSAPSAPIAAILRSASLDLRHADEALLILCNRTGQIITVDPGCMLQPAGLPFGAVAPDGAPHEISLDPGAVHVLPVRRRATILADATSTERAAEAVRSPRLVLEAVSPCVDGGPFPAKRVVGEAVTVDALLYGDGHEQLAAELQWRPLDEEEWRIVRMMQRPNDAWRAVLALERLGRHEFAVEGWLDRYGGYRRDFGKKREAGVAEPVDYAEGRMLVEQARARADRATSDAIAGWLTRYDAALDDDGRAQLLLAEDIAGLMDAADDRPHRVRSAPRWIDAERIEARFSSWYELFPRSITDSRMRHGTFHDVIERLPMIRAMGFDTLYFPPIHPIGRTNRKGPNNTLTPGPDDVGSPYAIGSADGGHEAVHPALGTLADFDRLVSAAADHGLEIALDFAIQCSPDHPWLAEHPGWFAWRPDGSMKYAENPPKKYQDIVNVDFYGPDAVPDLWRALRDIVLLWVAHGVKVFRVDNPHTKPLPFWEWMIGEVRALHPETIFLAEAFTRPNMMYRLAKIGFSQSYTYFTWRNGKQELIDYITELTTTDAREFYRPHFFVNTPDINPPYLQTSGRPGFRIRAVLAATLSGLFGVYSGFELCEAAPVPGKEEYLDSEKYEIRPRDWRAPGDIVADIALLNRLRRAYPALQTHLNTRFYVARDENILYYGKVAPDSGDLILVMVNLDPHQAHDCAFEVPLWELGLADDGIVSVEDLAQGHRFDWRGKDQWIRLAPEQPYRIWRIWSAS